MPEDLEAQYLAGFVADPTALFDMAERSLAWDDRMHSRRTASCGVAYNYSGISYPDCEMPPFVQELAARIAGVAGHGINNCLANFYADGAAKMGFHSDSSAGVAAGTTTSIVSLGAPRVLTFRRRSRRGERHDMALAPGSLLIMRASVQEGWQHAVLAVEAAGPRISLTFRSLSR
ncbi:alpha-ketoglutarate-dependent dioxygenase AlkB [Sorangium sp. So ce185]|uniref:alpha-ketoglutarate-dependent dioxygenase AlkB n=1 Tax=Sorangium sp. So ce185 TaxID=3133287 RepID=UPI003F607970